MLTTAAASATGDENHGSTQIVEETEILEFSKTGRDAQVIAQQRGTEPQQVDAIAFPRGRVAPIGCVCASPHDPEVLRSQGIPQDDQLAQEALQPGRRCA